MKQKLIVLCAVALMISSCNGDDKNKENKKETTSSQPATDNKETQPPSMDPAAMEKAMKDFAIPGDMHKWLAKFNGTWEATVVGFMNPAMPDTSKATQSYAMILNGLYQEGKFSGNMMGGPFEGRSTTGYDNAKKMFVSTWIDNLGSGIITMSGTYDEATRTMNLKGTQTNPVTGKDTGIREVMKIIDDNNYTLEMYGDGPDGKEVKYMEGTFKREK